MKRLFFLFLFLTHLATAQEDKVYTDLKEALKHPDEVYILNLDRMYIPDKMTITENTVYLDYGNKKSIEKLPKEISKFHNLKKLVLNNNHFDSIPEVVFSLSNLEELSMTGLKKIQPQIKNLKSLKKLDLGGNHLKELPLEIDSLINLIFLDVSSGKLTKIPPFPHLVKLETYNLFSNQLTELPNEIELYSKLKMLQMGTNPIIAWDKEFAKCKNLKELKNLNLGGASTLRVLPPVFFELSSLEYVELRGTGITEIPDDIGRLKNLKVLFVSNEHYRFPRKDVIRIKKLFPDTKDIHINVPE